jgi:CNT family concentrative nucleoside transporter
MTKLDVEVEIDDEVLDIETIKPLYLKRGPRILVLHAIIWFAATAFIGYAATRNQREAKDGFYLIVIAYGFLTIRLAAKHISISKLVYRPVAKFLIRSTTIFQTVRPGVRLISLALLLVIVILVCIFAIPESELGTSLERLQSFFGIIVIILLLYLSSNDRPHVNFRTVVVGMSINYAIALFVLKTVIGIQVFNLLLLARSSGNSQT